MKKRLLSLAIIFITSLFIISPSFALTCDDFSNETTKCVPTSILGEEKEDPETGEKIHCKCDDGKGSSIKDVLQLVVEIMTIGIGVLGVIGILIVGTQYLTAGDSEEKTRKAKRRLFEIVIGLIAYAIFYAILNWLGVANT